MVNSHQGSHHSIYEASKSFRFRHLFFHAEVCGTAALSLCVVRCYIDLGLRAVHICRMQGVWTVIEVYPDRARTTGVNVNRWKIIPKFWHESLYLEHEQEVAVFSDRAADLALIENRPFDSILGPPSRFLE